ncbi:RNA methyltransferase [Sediminibacterium sp.]|uniref:RNA methyltransferase n=1 Tax=Sediminibacterium sp. TaxID=1917865 RepID=UPI0025D512D9|nr:RNA methyltransferase [Sediminibacterium sp.]MBW0177843.1 RNA methyltransferase [Sediminibacterium sp.]
MLSKNELKYIQSLCQKKQRTAERLFLAEGVKLAAELLDAGYPVKKIYAVEEWEAPVTSVPVTRIPLFELEKISSLQTPNQVLLIAEQQEPAGEPVLKNNFTLVLDGIQDPGNLGTIIRIADWFGINQVIASKDTAELYNPKVIQATMGSFLRVKTWYRDLETILAQKQVPVYGALLNGKSMYSIESVKEGILVIGNESKGIRETVLPLINQAITIPRMGKAESLNAAVATGILLSQLKSPQHNLT